jgi:uncharacterized Zn finger protein
VEAEQLTLTNFRNELDESVLERGWVYFNNGWVKVPREIMPGYYEAVVEEVNPHAVSFSLDEDGIFTDVFCTCGNKTHAVCKHMAAVIFVYEKKAPGRKSSSRLGKNRNESADQKEKIIILLLRRTF